MEKKQVWVGFSALCLLSGSGWVLDQWRPEVLSGLARTSVHAGALALILWVASALRRTAWRRGVAWVSVGAWATGLWAVPQVVIAGAAGRVSGVTEVLVFGLVPVVVALILAQSGAGFGMTESPLRMLTPSLVGVSGLALLVPFAMPASAAGWAWLLTVVASAALAGLAAVRLHGLLIGADLLQAAAVACGFAALVAGGFCWVGWGGVGDVSAGNATVEAGRCLLVDCPVLLLTVWLLREMAPVRFSTRYLLVPLVTIVEGFLLVRPMWNWTMLVALLLLAGGCAGLLRADSGEARVEL